MNQNRTLSVSLSLLSHPISVGAMLLLLFNDHILRINWPSWWTGKLGDFAWLFFFPYALGVVVALIIPARVPAQAGLVSSLAFGLTGGVFILVKMLPFFHSWFIRLASHFLAGKLPWCAIQLT